MSDKDQKNRHLQGVVRRLLETETGEDAMICHDGGFRYAGDFMSIESDVIEPASILSPDDRRELSVLGYIEMRTNAESYSVRVTAAGRAFAFGDGSPS